MRTGSIGMVPAAAFALLSGGAAAQEIDCGEAPDVAQHHHIPANADTVHWGYFSKAREPRAIVHSGDLVTLETLTHHANDDAAPLSARCQ